MKARRASAAGLLVGAVLLGLTACTPGIPIAFHVEGDVVDVAFCESFDAASVEIDFSKYPPPLFGPKYSIGMWTASGPTATFGHGVPVSASIADWNYEEIGPVPQGWHRVDFSFYDAKGGYVYGAVLFDRDVRSSDWAWQEGYNINAPQCQIDLS